MDTNDKKLLAHLQDLLDTTPRTIEYEVAQWLQDESSPFKSLEDLLQHGCVSGTVPGMVYYTDTRKFFDNHYRQINQLYQDSDAVLPKDGNLRNWLSWFAFETVAYNIYLAIEDMDYEEE